MDYLADPAAILLLRRRGLRATPVCCAAAKAIAASVPANELGEEYIMPSIFDTSVVRTVARDVAAAARKTGVARRRRRRS